MPPEIVATALLHAHYLKDDATAIYYCTRAMRQQPGCVRARRQYVVAGREPNWACA